MAKSMVKKKTNYREKRKKRQKIVFWILTVFLSLGLLGSSAVWLGGNYFSPSPESAQLPTQEETVNNLEARVKENPNDVQSVAALARAYFNAGQMKEAQQAYEKALAQKPEESSWRLELAMVSFYLNDYDKAVVNLEEEIKRHPENKEAYYLYGQVLAIGKKDYQRGIEELEKFITLAKSGDDVAKARQMIEEWKKVQK